MDSTVGLAIPACGTDANSKGGITILAITFAAGIVIAEYQPWPLVWPWIILSGVGLVAAWIARTRIPQPTVYALSASMLCVGVAWVTVKQNYVAHNNLAAWIDEEPVLARLRGIALTEPRLKTVPPGSFTAYDFHGPATGFHLEASALIAHDSTETKVQGNINVVVDGTVTPFRVGDYVELIGFLSRPDTPHNPGEFNYRKYSRDIGVAGMLHVKGREAITITPLSRHTLWSGFIHWRDMLRARASAWLLSDLPDTEQSQRDALLASLLLGHREKLKHETYAAFQRVGIAHILAISGFHLGVLAGFTLLIARAFGGSGRWHGWLVIATVLTYLLIVDVRMPVMRAGIMIIVGCLGMVTSRRLCVRNLVALSAIILLLWRPEQIFNAGFQLSYAVVLGLLHFVPRVKARLAMPFTHGPATNGEIAIHWLKDVTVVALVAWAIASPIAAYHFGLIGPFAVPLTIIIAPLASAVLAVGFLKMLMALVLPSAAIIVGVPLSILAEFMLSIVLSFDSLPGTAMYVPFPTMFWTCAALAWVCWWASGVKLEFVRTRWIAFAVIVTWLLWPILPIHHRPALRIDMLAVGDGSCYVVRSGGETILFDAGSRHHSNVGRDSIIPAMRRLGIRSVDAMILSHPNFDHYSAAIDIADDFNVQEVLVSKAFFELADDDAASAVAHLLSGLTNERVAIRTVTAGDFREFGESRWTWLHPSQGGKFTEVNDASMVIRVEAAGRSVLFCGDIQEDAMELLMDGSVPMTADVVELPHHGGFHESAVTFIELVNPEIVLQSSGFRRWKHDRWSRDLADRKRLVTARDGACWVEIEDDGTITTGRFRNIVPIPADRPVYARLDQ